MGSSGSDLVLLAASAAIAIAEGLPAEDIGLLAGLFTAIGDNLAIIAVKKELCEDGS